MPERPDAAGDHRPPDRLITPKDAADRLAVSPSTVLLWLQTGQLKGVKAGKLWRIRERAIDEFLKEPEPVRQPPRADRFGWGPGRHHRPKANSGGGKGARGRRCH